MWESTLAGIRKVMFFIIVEALRPDLSGIFRTALRYRRRDQRLRFLTLLAAEEGVIVFRVFTLIARASAEVT